MYVYTYLSTLMLVICISEIKELIDYFYSFIIYDFYFPVD